MPNRFPKFSGRTTGPSSIGVRVFATILPIFVVVVVVLCVTQPIQAQSRRSNGSKPEASQVEVDPINTILANAWQEAEIEPSPVCSDPEFLRRAYLDILGRVPNVEEASRFLQDPAPSASKRDALVDKLLEHPDFAKFWADELAILLIGRRDQDREVDREALKAWLRRQINANRPWNEVAFDLITATGSNKANGAVNFTLAHFADEKVNLTSFTTRVLLGQQIQCTQCHDHPSNDWKQADFWGINAFYKGTKRREVEKVDSSGAEVVDHVELYDEPSDDWAQFERRNAVVGVVPPTYLDGRRVMGSEVDRRVELGRMLADPDNKQFARAFVNRVWGHFLGRGVVQPIDDFGDHNPPSVPALLDKLSEDFRGDGYNVKNLIRRVAKSRAYGLSSVLNKSNEQDDVLFSRFYPRPMTPEQLFDSLLTATDAHQVAGDASEQRRRQWLGQFVTTFANDEAGETTSFQGTIPQALMMMNGELMAKATGNQPGSFLRHVFDEARLQRKLPAPAYAANQIYLAALSRYPSSGEQKQTLALLRSTGDTVDLLADLFWSLLNSSEFALVH